MADTDHLAGPPVDSVNAAHLQRKRSFTLQKKRISEQQQAELIELYDSDITEFRKQSAALLRDNPDLFNMNDIGTVADDQNHVTLERFEFFFDGLLNPQLCKMIFDCIDPVEDEEDVVPLTAINRFLSGRSKVAQREKTIIDASWLVEKLRDVDIGAIDEDGDNRIQKEEFRHFFQNLDPDKKISDEMVDQVFYDIDKDHDDEITTFEYFKWKDGFKKHAEKHILPATVRKSTTTLKKPDPKYKARQREKVTFAAPRVGGQDDEDEKAKSESSELEQLKAEIERLKKENAEKDALIDEKDKRIEEVTSERDELQRKLDEMSTSMEEHTNKAKQKEAECEHLKNDKNQLQVKVSTLEQQVKERETEKQTLANNLSDVKKQVNDAKASSDDANALNAKVLNLQTLLAASQEKASEHEKVEKEKEELKRQCQASQQSVQAKEAEIAEYQAKLQGLQREHDAKVSELEKKYEALQAGQSERSSQEEVGDDASALQRELAAKQAMIEKLKHENEAELKMIERDKDNLCDQLQDTYQVINEELAFLEKKHKNQQLKKSKRKLVESPEDLRKKLRKFKSKMESKDAKLREMKHEQVKHAHDDNEEDEQEEDGSESSDGADFQFSFKNLFVFLKDF